MDPTPTIGRIVLFRSVDYEQECPAIVTAVHYDTCVSLTVFPFAAPPTAVISVLKADDFEASGQTVAWRWMDYQKAQAAK